MLVVPEKVPPFNLMKGKKNAVLKKEKSLSKEKTKVEKNETIIP